MASPRARGKLQHRSMSLGLKDPAVPPGVGRKWCIHPPRNFLSLLAIGFPIANLLNGHIMMLMLLTWVYK